VQLISGLSKTSQEDFYLDYDGGMILMKKERKYGNSIVTINNSNQIQLIQKYFG
jgi:hypothetical protein